jgi:hypothetical protein
MASVILPTLSIFLLMI